MPGLEFGDLFGLGAVGVEPHLRFIDEPVQRDGADLGGQRCDQLIEGGGNIGVLMDGGFSDATDPPGRQPAAA